MHFPSPTARVERRWALVEMMRTISSASDHSVRSNDLVAAANQRARNFIPEYLAIALNEAEACRHKGGGAVTLNGEITCRPMRYQI